LYQEDFYNKFLCFGGAVLSIVIFAIGKEHGFAEHRYFIHIIALSVFLFLSFMHINIQSKFINRCASTTFGVYLLHENAVVTFWLWNGIFAIQNYVNTVWFVPVSIASVIITFVVCAVIDYLRQILVEPLFMKVMKTPKISNCLMSIDDKMPKNCVKAEDGVKPSLAPALVLLGTNVLYFLCEMAEYFIKKPISYKMFLLITVIVIVAVVIKKQKIKQTD
jgi:hypothetical protein